MLIHVPSDACVLAMDVHKNTISTALLEPTSTMPVLDKISTDEKSVRRLIVRLVDPARAWACYEAGPTGYELARVLGSAGVRCEVIAPSLIPTRQGDRVKTDRRDARRLALLFRAGQLSAVRVPTVAEEAVRDLCRARADMVIDRTRGRHRLGKFLLRHGRVWRGGDNWTLKHQAWIRAQRFDDRALNITLAHYQATLLAREAAVDAIDADLAEWFTRAPLRRGRAPLGRLPGHHPCRQRAPADPAGRVGLGLQVQARRRGGAPPPPGKSRPRRRRSSLGRPAAAVRQVPPPRRPQDQPQSGRHRRGPRARRVRLGGDDRRLT